MPFSVQSWHFFLGAVSVINLIAWLVASYILSKRQAQFERHQFAIRRWQVLLSLGYVLGCAYRSFFPVFDVPRIVMVDSYWASALVGRSVATFAELCFMAQLAAMLHSYALEIHSAFARRVAVVAVPIIVVAELSSWFAVLTTNNIGHVIEEMLWGSTMALFVIAMLMMRARCSGPSRYMLDFSCIAGIGYVGFMFSVDVPMYLSRWLADEAENRMYFTIANGIHDAWTRRTVSLSWEQWQQEVPWMTLYFSGAVWFSISLINAPVAQNKEEAERPRVAMANT